MTLDCAVRRRETELVGPARQMPRETKRLSDIEDQVGLRWHVPFVLFYRGRRRQPDGCRPPHAQAGAGAVLPTRTSREASFSPGILIFSPSCDRGDSNSGSPTPALARVAISSSTTHLT